MEIEALTEIWIVKCHNWYIIKQEKEDYESVDINHVIEIKDWEDQDTMEQEAFRDLVLHLQEIFWIYYSKHNKTNLEIDIVKYNS